MHRIFVAASCVAASCCFIDASRVTEVFFRTNFPRQCRFASRVINCQLLNLFQRRYMLTLLAVKLSPLHPSVILTPPHPAVIFHPSCWRSNSPLSAQRSSSLLVANLTPPHPAVIFYPSCWRSNSPLSTLRSSYSTILLVANLTPPHPSVIFFPSC